jgi:hypothetical protein
VGHQLNFHATPADIAELETDIRKQEPIAIIHSRSPTANPLVLPSLSFVEGGEPFLFYRLVRESDLSEVVTRHVPAQGYWTVDVLRSPVVEFNSCYFDGKILRRGRAYYVDGFYGEGEAWVEKPESFRLWARGVLRILRKSLKRHGTDYIGRDALSWLQHDGGKLVP